MTFFKGFLCYWIFWSCTFIPALLWDRSDKGCQIWVATISPWHHGKEQQESGKHQRISSVTPQLHFIAAKVRSLAKCQASGQGSLAWLFVQLSSICLWIRPRITLPEFGGYSMHQGPLPKLVWMRSPFFRGKRRSRQDAGSCEEAEFWGPELWREADEAVNVALVLC